MTTQTALIIDRIPLDVHTIIFGYLNLQDSISLLRVRIFLPRFFQNSSFTPDELCALLHALPMGYRARFCEKVTPSAMSPGSGLL